MTREDAPRARAAPDAGCLAELVGVGAEEHQVVQHPVELGEQGPQPHRTDRHLDAEHPLDGEHDAELVGEGAQPVVPVGEHDDLPVVADLEELLDAAVQEPDLRLAVRRSGRRRAAAAAAAPRASRGGAGRGRGPRRRETCSTRVPRPRSPPSGHSSPAHHRVGGVDDLFAPPGAPWQRVSPRLAVVRRWLLLVATVLVLVVIIALHLLLDGPVLLLVAALVVLAVVAGWAWWVIGRNAAALGVRRAGRGAAHHPRRALPQARRGALRPDAVRRRRRPVRSTSCTGSPSCTCTPPARAPAR